MGIPFPMDRPKATPTTPQEDTMGFFDKITKAFEKEECGVCGAEIGILGKKKLEDGVICKNCEAKLSPFFTGRRGSTLEAIKAQIAYREANEAHLAHFDVTRTLGLASRKVHVDDNAGEFIVTSSSKWRENNPDIISFGQVTGCNVDVDETKTEIKYKDAEGKEVSYDPKRYDIDYDVIVTILVDSPYFEEIKVKVNPDRCETKACDEFVAAMNEAEAIRSTLTQTPMVEYQVSAADQKAAIMEGIAQGGIMGGIGAGLGAMSQACQKTSGLNVARAHAAANTAANVVAPAPKAEVTCPWCYATTTPDANNHCEFCGGDVSATAEDVQAAAAQAAQPAQGANRIGNAQSAQSPKYAQSAQMPYVKKSGNSNLNN